MTLNRDEKMEFYKIAFAHFLGLCDGVSEITFEEVARDAANYGNAMITQVEHAETHKEEMNQKQWKLD